MTLEQAISDNYAWTHNLDGGRVTADPAPALAASEVSRASIVARRDELAAVEARCIVSRTARVFLDRVLALD